MQHKNRKQGSRRAYRCPAFAVMMGLAVSAMLANWVWAAAPTPFTAPALSGGSVDVRLYPMEGVTGSRLVTFGLPFTRGSITAAGLAKVRVLKNGVEIPAYVAQLTPWRHFTNAALDGVSVRVARIQLNYTFATNYPGYETITVEWGLASRSQNIAGLSDPRSAWHLVTNGTFSAADNVYEPDVYAVIPKNLLCLGILKPGAALPFAGTVTETRDNPATMTTQHYYPDYRWLDYGAKNFFFSLINEDDPAVTAANKCLYRAPGEYEPWLYDRSAAMFAYYFRSGFIKPLREAVRHADFYRNHIKASGFFDIKSDYDDAKYSYNESLAYAHWLTGDNLCRDKIATVVAAHAGTPTRWTPTLGMWTERHTGFKLLANAVAYEVLGDVSYKTTVQTIVGDFIWLQDGAAGQIPSTGRVDGGLYHYGAQHDWDWAETELGASPWMSVLIADAMLRVYPCVESTEIATFMKRLGNFLKTSCILTTYDGNTGVKLDFPRYGVLYDGRDGQADEWSDIQHALEVGGALAWCNYFAALVGTPDATLGAKVDSLFRTFDDQVTGWVRPGGPAAGLTAYRVSPWRKYGWEYRPSIGIRWALNAAVGSNAAPTVSIIGPVAGSIYGAPPALIGIQAIALDSDGLVAKVEFFADGRKLGEDVTSPYGFSWTNVPAGSYLLTAVATDNLGAKTTSGGVAVYVPRDPATWPFAQNSPWNTPLGSGAAYAAETSPRFGATNPNQAAGIGSTHWSHPVWISGPTDPLRNLYRTYPADIFQVMRVPDAAAPDPEADGHMHLIDDAHTFVCEIYQAARTADGGWRGGDAGDIKKNLLKGKGISDPYNAWDYIGTRAYGGSAIGGLIRKGELVTGIRHPLGVAVERASMNKNGPGGLPFVWPACNADSGYGSTYGTSGNVCMGSLLALPPGLDITTIPGVGTSGAMYELAKAMQDYGAIISDASSDNMSLVAEPAAAGGIPDSQWTVVPQLVDLLQVVTNSSPSAIGGGGTPRRLPAPPFVDEAPLCTVSGPGAVSVSATITLTASTTRGTDSAYTWVSLDPAIATVSSSGLVTGVSAGTAVITAAGNSTKAVGAWTVTVQTGSGGPVAVFSAAPASGGAPLAVTFADASTGSISNRFWNFGDGSITNTAATNVLHTYRFPGTNTVQLIVSGLFGSATNIQGGLIRAASVDTVGDGIPDWWRALYFGGDGRTTNAVSGAGCDPIGSGRNNLYKYTADLNPTNPASRFAIIDLTITGGVVRIAWTGGSNAWQFVECSHSLTAKQWVAIFTNPPPTATTANFIHAGPAAVSNAFYRVRAHR